MKNISILNKEEIFEPNVLEVIEIIDKALASHGIDFYLIGARARDFWLKLDNQLPARATKDIDFAILISQNEEFEELSATLVNKFGFHNIKNIPHRFSYKNGLVIDLIPFQNIKEFGYIQFNDKFETKISVFGMQEVYNSLTEIELDKELKIKIASLPGICLLKLISWNDRPEERYKDIEDIILIIEKFFHIESDEIWEKHNDLFGGDIELEDIAARVIGRQMNEIIGSSKNLKSRIIEILEKLSNEDDENNPILHIGMDSTGGIIFQYINFIELIRKGLDDYSI